MYLSIVCDWYKIAHFCVVFTRPLWNCNLITFSSRRNTFHSLRGIKPLSHINIPIALPLSFPTCLPPPPPPPLIHSCWPLSSCLPDPLHLHHCTFVAVTFEPSDPVKCSLSYIISTLAPTNQSILFLWNSGGCNLLSRRLHESDSEESKFPF